MKKEIVSTETRRKLEPYTAYLAPIKKEQAVVSREGTVESGHKIYSHKKLLPYAGSRIVLNEYPDRVTLVSRDGLLIVELYKDICGSEEV